MRAAIRFVRVDLDDGESIDAEGVGRLVPTRVVRPREDEARAASRNDGRRHVRAPEIGTGAYARDFDISAVSDTSAHHGTAILTEKVVGQYFRYGVPVAGREPF